MTTIRPACLWLLLPAQCVAGPKEDFFESSVRPVLAERCFSCHSQAAKKSKGGLLLDSREAVLKMGDTGLAVIAGKPADSLLIRAVERADADYAMPPTGNPLAFAQIRHLEAWVACGAVYPGGASSTKRDPAKHRAFQPIRPALPPTPEGEAFAELDRGFADANGKADALEAAIRSYELATKLQTAVPDLLDLSKESKATLARYGFDEKFEHTRTYGRQCLLARRLLERGVRFVTLTMPRVDNDTRWDAHGNLKKNHSEHALTVDRPIAALLDELVSTGLWADTPVVLTTEFGRTPFTQGSDGRDHNQYGFTSVLGGGAVKNGFAYGATDDYGYKAVENPMHVHDFHATLLHILGLDHTKLTYRFGAAITA